MVGRDTFSFDSGRGEAFNFILMLVTFRHQVSYSPINGVPVMLYDLVHDGLW